MVAALVPLRGIPLVRLVSGAVVSCRGEGQMARAVMSYMDPQACPRLAQRSLLSSDPQIGHKLDIIVSIKN